MSLSVKFNGSELNKYISVLRGFTPRKGVSWDPQMAELSAGTRGTKYKTTAYKSKTISMPFSIEGDIETKYNELQKILNVKEPKELIFGSTPNKVYYAIPSGDLDLDEILCFGSGTINWVIPEGVAHSAAETTATNKGTSNTIALKNNGTESVPVNVKATMKSDNGYLGLVLDDRFYQIGNPGEVDGETKEKTVKLFDDHFTQNRGWVLNGGVTPVVTPERRQVGTVGYTVENAATNEGYVKATNYGSGDSWHGPALTKIIPADENGEYPTNWRCEYRFDFNTDGGGPSRGKQIGHSSVTFSDENDDIICSVVFEDNNPVMERSDMALYIENKRVWDTRETQKFYVTGRGGGGPAAVVEKIGNTITVGFTHGGIKKTFFLSNPSATLRKVTWYCAAYKNYTPIQNNNIRALNVRKHNVQYYEDIPNFLSDGDVVELNSSSNELYINDIKDWDRVDIGSKPLLLPPGQHTLGIAVSDFAKIPEVEVTYRERWL